MCGPALVGTLIAAVGVVVGVTVGVTAWWLVEGVARVVQVLRR